MWAGTYPKPWVISTYLLESPGVNVIEGRVHENTNLVIKPSDIDENDIGKFIVPFVPIYDEDGNFLDMKADVGEMESMIYMFESKQEDIYKYLVELSPDGEVVGFTKK